MSQEIRDAGNKLLPELSSLDRGDMISHARIEQLTDVPHGTLLYMNVIEAIRNIMLTPERGGIWLDSVHGEGYRLVSATEQIGAIATERQEKAIRHLRRTLHIVESVPSKELSVNQRRLQHQRMVSLEDSIDYVKDNLKHERIIMKPLEQMPRPPLERLVPDQTATPANTSR